ncbi:MAG: hypothetical protein KDJ74_06770 [Notoacmeibacter sp.]|nr:hypothetical protein [Notoacmeibacter sp.]
MRLLGNLLLGFGALLGLLGLLTVWMPIFGLLCLTIGFGLFVVGQFLRRKGRQHAVLRKQGDRGLF